MKYNGRVSVCLLMARTLVIGLFAVAVLIPSSVSPATWYLYQQNSAINAEPSIRCKTNVKD